MSSKIKTQYIGVVFVVLMIMAGAFIGAASGYALRDAPSNAVQTAPKVDKDSPEFFQGDCLRYDLGYSVVVCKVLEVGKYAYYISCANGVEGSILKITFHPSD